MKASETPFISFMQKTTQFSIPIYQRTYSWTNDQCTQLWNDIDGSNSKKLVPIHTQHDEYHKKWHSNVQSVNQHEMVNL
jgi:uncharacterized protein with ParB-like and HNH nuclease domain